MWKLSSIFWMSVFLDEENECVILKQLCIIFDSAFWKYVLWVCQQAFRLRDTVKISHFLKYFNKIPPGDVLKKLSCQNWWIGPLMEIHKTGLCTEWRKLISHFSGWRRVCNGVLQGLVLELIFSQFLR